MCVSINTSSLSFVGNDIIFIKSRLNIFYINSIQTSELNAKTLYNAKAFLFVGFAFVKAVLQCHQCKFASKVSFETDNRVSPVF